MTNNCASNTNELISTLPPVLDLRALEKNFHIGRTTAYQLASSGEILTLSIGLPGKRGKRMFLTQSVLDFVQRRLASSKPLNCKTTRTDAPEAL